MKCTIEARSFTETLLRDKVRRLSYHHSRTSKAVCDDINEVLNLWYILPSDDISRITAYEIADCLDNVMAHSSIEEDEAVEIVQHVVRSRSHDLGWDDFYG